MRNPWRSVPHRGWLLYCRPLSRREARGRAHYTDRRPRQAGRLDSAAEARERALDLADIGAVEQADMDEQRIEVVEVAPLLEEAGCQRPQFPIAAEEGLAQAVEER